MVLLRKKITVIFFSVGIIVSNLAAAGNDQENTCTAIISYKDPLEVIKDSIQRAQDALMGKVIKEYYSNDSLASWLNDECYTIPPEKVCPDVFYLIIDAIKNLDDAICYINIHRTAGDIVALGQVNKEFYQSFQAILNTISPIDVSSQAKLLSCLLGDKRAFHYAVQYGKYDLIQNLITMKKYEFRDEPLRLAHYMIQEDEYKNTVLESSCTFSSSDISAFSGGVVAQKRIAQILIDEARNACPDDVTFLEVINKPDNENKTLLMKAVESGNFVIVRKICAAIKRVYAHQPEKVIEEVCRVTTGAFASSTLIHSSVVPVAIVRDIISLVKEVCGNSGVLQVIGFHFVSHSQSKSACHEAVTNRRNLSRLQYLLDEALEASEGNFASFFRTVGVYNCLQKAFFFQNVDAVRSLCHALEHACNGDYQLIVNAICSTQEVIFEEIIQFPLLGDVYRFQFGHTAAFRYLDVFVAEMRRRRNQKKIEEVE